MKVLVGVSGGVDSALCASILKEQGHEVIGAMMTIYNGNNVGSAKNSCYGCDKTQEIQDAKIICEKLHIPFHLIDLSEEFNKIVLKNFKEEYLSGRTPNPCILCNHTIKFGELIKKAKNIGLQFNKFATGHYARCEFSKDYDRYLLKKGINEKKDQSYFLYRLTQEQLKNVIFPLGSKDKETTRKEAENRNIAVAKKPDSQDFYDGDIKDIINIEPKFGNIVDTNGNILGHHEGIFNYTIGQRKGLRIAYSEPFYVLNLDKDKNEVIVGTKSDTYFSGLVGKSLNWIAFENLETELEVKCKIRSSQKPFDCLIKPKDNNIIVEFKEKQGSIAKGQSIVFYDNDIVLGGAVIQEGLK